MSPTDEGRFTEAAILDLVEDAISTSTREVKTSKPSNDAPDATPAPWPWPPSAVIPAQIALSRKAHPRPFNDPSNYLG